MNPGLLWGERRGISLKVSGNPMVLLPAYSLLKQEQLQLAQASFRKNSYISYQFLGVENDEQYLSNICLMTGQMHSLDFSNSSLSSRCQHRCRKPLKSPQKVQQCVANIHCYHTCHQHTRDIQRIQGRWQLHGAPCHALRATESQQLQLFESQESTQVRDSSPTGFS